MKLDNGTIFGVSPTVETDGLPNEQDTQDSTLEGNENVEETTEEITEEESPENNDPAQEQPLIMGKYKTQDDLIRAYKALQADYTRIKQAERMAPQEETQSYEASEEERLIAWYNENVLTNPVQANAVLAQYMAKREIDSYKAEISQQIQPIVNEKQASAEIMETAGRYEDFFNYYDAVHCEAEMISQEDPELFNSPRLWETAYLRAKARELETKAQSAFENGKKTAIEERNSKKRINNELNKTNNEGDALPEGVTIIGQGDGIFL